MLHDSSSDELSGSDVVLEGITGGEVHGEGVSLGWERKDEEEADCDKI